jgi:hypothetical protein
MDRRHLIYYLLLNIFISACVTLSILYWYDRNYRAASLPQPAAPAIASNVASAASQVPLPSGSLKIISVVGAGSLNVEMVTLQYLGSSQADLTGWHLKDSKGNDFTFPPFKLFPQGALRVHTAAGTNTPIDVYWGNSQAVWSSGQTITLTDANGTLQDSYPVP